MFFLVFKQKTAYEMRISDWSSDVCSSDLPRACAHARRDAGGRLPGGARRALRQSRTDLRKRGHRAESRGERRQGRRPPETARQGPDLAGREGTARHLSVSLKRQVGPPRPCSNKRRAGALEAMRARKVTKVTLRPDRKSVG